MADDRPGPPRRNASRNKKTPEPVRAERPFDLWLNRQLHSMYDDIANEPLPRSVLDLIERDKQIADGEAGAVDNGDPPPGDITEPDRR